MPLLHVLTILWLRRSIQPDLVPSGFRNKVLCDFFLSPREHISVLKVNRLRAVKQTAQSKILKMGAGTHQATY